MCQDVDVDKHPVSIIVHGHCSYPPYSLLALHHRIEPGYVQVSETTMQLLDDKSALQATGGVDVKGLGMMSTYLWAPPIKNVEVLAVLETLSRLTTQSSATMRLSVHQGSQAGMPMSPMASEPKLTWPSFTQPSQRSGGGGRSRRASVMLPGAAAAALGRPKNFEKLGGKLSAKVLAAAS